MRVLFAGSPEVALPTLEALLASAHEVVGVLTRPPAPSGRGRRLTPSPVSVRAREHGLAVLELSTLRTDEAMQRVRALGAEVAVVVAYGALVPPALLTSPEHGWVNLHFSLLPAWRGAAPVQYAIRHGDEVTGATTILLEAGLDTGPVLGMMTEEVRPTDTAGELLNRLAVAGAPLVLRTLEALEDGSARPVPQEATGVSLAPRITVDDARVRWSEPASAIDRLIRSTTPAPGAWTILDGARMKLGPVTPLPAAVVSLEPGQIDAGKERVVVGAGTGGVVLGQVAPAGKGWMDATAWTRGARLDPNARFEDAGGSGS